MSLLHQYSKLVNKGDAPGQGSAKSLELDMAIFQLRMGDTGQEDVAKTYAEVHRLIDNPSKIVAQPERLEVAADIIHRAAFPTQSNQGDSNDCAAAGVENRLYTRNPAQAAKLVTDTALTGHFTDSLLREITVSHGTIASHDPPLTVNDIKYGIEPRRQGDRIMQAIVRNADYAFQNLVPGPNSGNRGLKYEIGAHTRENPTGEYIRDFSEKPPRDVSLHHQGMVSDLSGVYSMLTPMQDKTEFSFADPDATGLNVEQFKQKLEALKGQYPVLVAINPFEEPFTLRDHNRQLSPWLHNITLEDYDPTNGMIKFRDPEQGSIQGSISVSKMFDAMRANLEDDFGLRLFGEKIKSHRDDFENHPEQGGQVVSYVLNMAEANQRTEVLRRLEEYTGMNLGQYLTDERKQELGVAKSSADFVP